MRPILIAFDPNDPAQALMAGALSERGVAAAEPVLYPLGRDGARPALAGNVASVVLLDAEHAPAMRHAIEQDAPAARLVAVFTQAWPRAIERFHRCYRACDEVVVTDRRLWQGLGGLPRTHWIPFGADGTRFRAVRDPCDRERRVVWIGDPETRRRRRYEPWIFDPEGFLAAIGFRGRALEPGVDAEERAAILNEAAVAVLTTRDPRARATLYEAASCGCAIVAAAADAEGLVDAGFVARIDPADPRGLSRAIEACYDDRATLARRAREWAAEGDWSAFADRVSKVAEKPVTRKTRARARADLREQVTVFVSTVGAPSFESCLAHLAQQDSAFRLEIVRDVAPMSAAFQQMLDRCKTPFYVQVDEDMLLFPSAVRQLHRGIAEAAPNVALRVAWLFDTHFRQPVQGVKIFRHEVVSRYPLANVRSCEIDQVERMRADGFVYEVMPRHGDEGDEAAPGGAFPYRILGLHGTHHTPRTVFERFRTLELARHKHPGKLKHQESWPAMLLERFLEDRDPLDFFALAGLLSGACSAQDLVGQEKDFRAYSSMPGFDAASQLFSTLVPKASRPGAHPNG